MADKIPTTNPYVDQLIADVNSDMVNPYQIVREPYSPKTPAGEALREILRAAFPPPADGSKYRLKRGEAQEVVRILEAARLRLNASRHRRQAS